jgi:diguanylate cyclase (GGDEF)-like protein
VAFKTALESEKRRSLLTDAVTGLPSAEYAKGLVASEISATVQGGHAVSLILVDVDGLRKVNTSVGRHTGDELLSKFAAAVKRLMRATDVLFRFDSDELVVALPQTDLSTATLIANRIEASAGSSDGVQHPRISVGVASAPVDGVSFEELLMVARSRLHHSARLKTERGSGAHL